MNSSVKLENDEIADFSSLLRHQNIFQCSKYELGFTPDSAWFNGDSASIIGQCECPDNMDWDNWEMTCYVSSSDFSGLLITPTGASNGCLVDRADRGGLLLCSSCDRLCRQAVYKSNLRLNYFAQQDLVQFVKYVNIYFYYHYFNHMSSKGHLRC